MGVQPRENEHWEVTLPNNLWVTAPCTWEDIQQTISALNALDGGETFAPLNRYEGGFSCESVPQRLSKGRKAIRFQGMAKDRWDWPSFETSLDNPIAPDEVVFQGGELLELRFEGLDCKKWTNERCEQFLHVVSTVLRWGRISTRDIVNWALMDKADRIRALEKKIL